MAPQPHLLHLSPEIRNAIYDLIILVTLAEAGLQEEGEGEYITLRQALKSQPKLVQTCRVLRREVLPMWFGRFNILLSNEDDLGIVGEDVFGALRSIALTRPCYGWAEFSTRAPVRGHWLLFHVRLGEEGFEVEERHGGWKKKGVGWSFESMDLSDYFGFDTCTSRGRSPIPDEVRKWSDEGFGKAQVLELLERMSHGR